VPTGHAWRVWLLLPALLVVVAAVYHPAWHGGLLWDDEGHITRPALRSLHGLWRIWTEVEATQQYYPLLHSAFWLQSRLWGDVVTGYHLVSIGLHALSAWLLAVTLRRLAVPGAVLAAVVFALHPVHVESVAWISELKNTLSGVFYLTAALAYLRFDETRAPRAYALALCCFVLGLLTKTVVATLPVSLLLVFWWRRGRIDLQRDVVPTLPFFALGLAFGLLTVWVERTVIGAEGAEFAFTPLDRILIAGRAIWFYLGKLAWPSDLTFIYARWEVASSEWWQFLYPVGVLVLVVALWTLRRWSRAPLAALALFVVALFPALGFFNVYPFRYAFVADHFQYLASLPIIAFASAAIASAAARWMPLTSATAVALVLVGAPLGTLTWRQSHDYVDAERLYRATIDRSPSSWMAHNNLALLLLDQGRVEDARRHLDEALRLNPGIPEHRLNVGRLLLAEGQPVEALPHLQAAVELNPRSVSAQNNLGVALMRLGRLDEAASRFEEVVRLQPDRAEAHANLADALHRLDRTAEAATHAERALDLDPRLPAAHNTAGLLAMAHGAHDEARASFSRAVDLDPRSADAWVNLGVALQHVGRPGEAAAALERAVGLRPTHAPAQYLLGVTLFRLGRVDEAVARLNQALRLDPRLPNAQNDLGAALLAVGRTDEAITALQEAVRQQPEHADAHYNLAHALRASGRLADAVTHYREAVRYDQADAALRHDLATALLALGRRGEAREQFAEALRLDPALSEARAALERLR